MLPQPISEDPPQTTESVAVAEDSDASVWQHMLQDFPGIGLPVEQQFTVDLAYMP